MNMLFHHLKAFGGKKIRKMWIIYIKKSFIGFQLLDLPDFISKKDFDWAVERATIKKKIDCSKVEFFTFEEGSMCANDASGFF